MWLCSTLARIASGTVDLPRFRKTAVPGTRSQGRLAAVELVDESPQRALLALRRAVTSARPRCQVVSTVNTMTAIRSGSQAPWVSLVRLAAKNRRSTVRNPPAPRSTSQSGLCHCWRTR